MLYADNSKRVQENRENHLYLSRMYAHGDLHDILGDDLLSTNSIILYNEIYNKHHNENKLILDWIAVDSNRVEYRVKMYIWLNTLLDAYQGLVCLYEDQESNEHALELYNNNSINI